MTGSARYTHLIGALTAPSAGEAMTIALQYLGPTLLSLPDGENPTKQFPTRHLWVQPELERIPELAGVVNRNPQAGMTGYDDTYWYSAERPLSADDFAPVVILRRAFEQTYPTFLEVRDRYRLPGLRYQIGTPAALDLAFFTFHEAGLASALHDPITDAKAAQVRAVHAQAPGVVFQMETPWSVRMVASSEDAAKTAEYAASMLVALPQRCPGTIWGIHLCDGDWFHKEMIEPGSALPLVLLANEIAAQWPACRRPRSSTTSTCRSPRPPSRRPWTRPGTRRWVTCACPTAAGSPQGSCTKPSTWTRTGRYWASSKTPTAPR